MAAFRQLSTHGQKFDPESLWAYVIWNFAPIFGQQISILDLPYIGLFGPSWSELSLYGWIAGRGVGWAGDIFFCCERTETWLLKSRLLAAMCERRD